MQWIKVSERYPPEGERVLIYNDFMEEIYIDYVIEFEDKKIWACYRECDWKFINRWMPLPKPPTKEE